MTITAITQLQNLQDLKGQLNYTNECLSNNIDEMQDFEVKEFLMLNSGLTSEINFLTNHCKNMSWLS